MFSTTERGAVTTLVMLTRGKKNVLVFKNEMKFCSVSNKEQSDVTGGDTGTAWRQ